MKILVTLPKDQIRDTFIPQEVAEKIKSLGETIWNDSKELLTADELHEMLCDVDVCITGWGCCKFNGYVLENANKLKIIAHTGGTVASIVSEPLFEKGIKVISGNNLYAESVAEGVIAYMLSSLRNIPYYAHKMTLDGWEKNPYSEGLIGQTVGLIGFGMITKHLVRMLKPFNVKVKVYSRHLREETIKEYGLESASMEEIFKTCKVISIHSALRPETHHIIDRKLLSMIPEGSILVNTARGSIIDEKALEEELETRRFKAVLDVFEVEPLPNESKLRKLSNVILIPHMGGPTVDRRKFVTLALIEDIKRYFNGEGLKNEITREYASVMTNLV